MVAKDVMKKTILSFIFFLSIIFIGSSKTIPHFSEKLTTSKIKQQCRTMYSEIKSNLRKIAEKRGKSLEEFMHEDFSPDILQDECKKGDADACNASDQFSKLMMLSTMNIFYANFLDESKALAQDKNPITPSE